MELAFCKETSNILTIALMSLDLVVFCDIRKNYDLLIASSKLAAFEENEEFGDAKFSNIQLLRNSTQIEIIEL